MRINTASILALTASFGIAKEETVSLGHYQQGAPADKKSFQEEKLLFANDGSKKANEKEQYQQENDHQRSKREFSAAVASATTDRSNSNSSNQKTRGYSVSSEDRRLQFSNQGALVNGETKKSGLQERFEETEVRREHRIMIDSGSVEQEADIGILRVESTNGTDNAKEHKADIGILSNPGFARMLAPYVESDLCQDGNQPCINLGNNVRVTDGSCTYGDYVCKDVARYSDARVVINKRACYKYDLCLGLARDADDTS